VLAVAARAKSLATFQGRGRLQFVSAVRFEACPERTRSLGYPSTVGKYTGFPFAFVLARRPACIPLEVWLDGQTTPIRRLVPFGRRSC
jgi:hypothetical protein